MHNKQQHEGRADCFGTITVSNTSFKINSMICIAIVIGAYTITKDY
jgi:hypothetical protein